MQPYSNPPALLGRAGGPNDGGDPSAPDKASWYSLKRYSGWFNVDTQARPRLADIAPALSAVVNSRRLAHSSGFFCQA